MRSRLCLAPLAFVFAVACVSQAHGDAIGVFGTGESTGGTALAVGVADPHYSLISAPATVPLTAITTTPVYWTGNTATDDWISPGSSGATSWPVGNYDYRTTFNLTGENPATAMLSGMWSSDNDACIYLNGANTGQCTPFAGFGSLQAFSLTSGFVAGVNTLDFVVDNGGGPTGVIAEVSGTVGSTRSVTPEPSSLMLEGSGLLALCGAARRRRSLRA